MLRSGQYIKYMISASIYSFSTSKSFPQSPTTMNKLTAEEQARAAAINAHAAAIESIYFTPPPDSRYVKLISDVNLLEGFKSGMHVILENRRESYRTPKGIQLNRQLGPADYIYKVKRYNIIGPKYRMIYSPPSGREVIPASSLSLDNPGRLRMRAVPLPQDIHEGKLVFLLKEVRWTGRGGIPIVVPRGATGQIVSPASRVGSETASRSNPAFQVLFWKKFYVGDFYEYGTYIEWGNLLPLAQGERPNIPTVPGESWATDYPELSQMVRA